MAVAFWVLHFGYLRLAMAMAKRSKGELAFAAAGKAMGSLNWFAVHPTSMTSDLDAETGVDETMNISWMIKMGIVGMKWDGIWMGDLFSMT